MESIYDDYGMVVAAIEAHGHRALVGGLWDEIGRLQFDFLCAHGLLPHHVLLDVGCGCLRGGIHFVRYLEPGHYYGLDSNVSLLDAGYAVELREAGLQQRLPRGNLLCNGDFDVSGIGRPVDFALALSLFTHLGGNRIRRCLEQLASVMAADGVFFATFFELPDSVSASNPLCHEPGGVVTYHNQDPYHYRFADLRNATSGLGWSVRHIGAWGHPRAQHMVAFTREEGEMPALPG